MTKTARITTNSRASDERTLDWLARRSAGEAPSVIAGTWGVGRGGVLNATNAVRTADIAESGEDRAEVEGAYW